MTNTCCNCDCHTEETNRRTVRAPSTMTIFGRTANLDEIPNHRDLEGDYAWGIQMDPCVLWVHIDTDELRVSLQVPKGAVETWVESTYDFSEGADAWERSSAEIAFAEESIIAELDKLGEVGMVMILGLKHANDYPAASDDDGED